MIYCMTPFLELVYITECIMNKICVATQSDSVSECCLLHHVDSSLFKLKTLAFENDDAATCIMDIQHDEENLRL
jgi:hypothetical protein